MTLQGKYLVDRIEMRAGNIVFTMGGGNHSVLPLGFGEALESEEEDNRFYIHCYPPPDGLHAKLVFPHLVNLENMRTLEIEVNSGRNDIQTGTIRVRPATAGLRVRVTEAEVVNGEIGVDASNEFGNIDFSQLRPHSSARIRVPYTSEENHHVLSARIEVVYETAQGRFSYSSVYGVVSALPLSVNVQDTFKDSVLFSRFTISPAMMVPLRVLSCHIPSTESYEVQSSIPDASAMDVFPKQPASVLYKIRQRAKRSTSEGSLRLTVEFTCVDEECLDAVQKKISADIESSKYRQYSSLLSSHVAETIRSQLSSSDMEVIGLIREVEVPSYQDLRWEGLLSAMNEPREEIKDWLLEWHKVSCNLARDIWTSCLWITAEQPIDTPPRPPGHAETMSHHPVRGTRRPSCPNRRSTPPKRSRQPTHSCSSRPNDRRRASPPTHPPLVQIRTPGKPRPPP